MMLTMTVILPVLNFMTSLMVTVVHGDVNIANCEFKTSCGDKFSFNRYFRMTEIYDYMDYLVNSYPEFVSSEIIGYSFEGREIKMLKILSGKSDSNSIWIDGGIHAREWIGVTTVMYIMVYLIENRDHLEPQIQETNFYFVPITNPDGYEYTHTDERTWRKNRNTNDKSDCLGVDLNRNFPSHWGEKDASTDPCDDVYGGPFAGSTVEVSVIMNALMERSYKAMVSFHNYSQFVLFPYGYTHTHVANYDELLRVGNLMVNAILEVTGTTYVTGSIADVIYEASGDEIDWAEDVTDILYCYSIELRDTGTYGHYLSSSEIVPCGEEGLAAVLTLVKQF